MTRVRLHASPVGGIDRDEVLELVGPSAVMRSVYRSARRDWGLTPGMARAVVIGLYVLHIRRP